MPQTTLATPKHNEKNIKKHRKKKLHIPRENEKKKKQSPWDDEDEDEDEE